MFSTACLDRRQSINAMAERLPSRPFFSQHDEEQIRILCIGSRMRRDLIEKEVRASAAMKVLNAGEISRPVRTAAPW